MKNYDRLIFVDEDDTTRAPMAKMIMKTKYLLGPLDIQSRGLVVLFPQPMNQKAAAILISIGIDPAEHEATQLRQEDMDDRTLFLTMEDGQKEKIWTNYENAAHVYTVAEFINLQGDVSALCGEPLETYGHSYETIAALINGIVIKFNEEELKK